MKTAISIPDDLFREVERVAEEYDYSRSEVFAMAVREFLERLKSQKILDALNSAYSEPESAEEDLRRAGKEYYKKKVLRKVGNQAR